MGGPVRRWPRVGFDYGLQRPGLVRLSAISSHKGVHRRSDSREEYGCGRGCAPDPRYLTAFGNTLSEIIIPVLDEKSSVVVGTIDVESEQANAFLGRRPAGAGRVP